MKTPQVLLTFLCLWNIAPSWSWIRMRGKIMDPVKIQSALMQYERGTGTTLDLKQKLISRCKEYQNLHKEFFKTGKRDCNKIYDVFESAFKHKAGCGVNVNSVIKFVDMTITELPKDKLMLWSKTYDIARKFSNNGSKVFTLEDTFPGYILDGLNFCGQINGHGINYASCPHWKNCKGDHPMSAFWTLASKKFATQSKGQIRVILDGSLDGKKPAYSETSILASQEIPNLNCKGITNIEIWVVHGKGKPIVNKCGHGSLVLLVNTLKRKGCKSTCIDDPKELAVIVG